MEFKDRLKELMKEKGVKVSQMSKDTGISKSAINNYLNAKSKPRLPHLLDIWRYFDVTLDYLTCHSDKKEYKHVKQK